jgi:hypothetical protein
MKYFNVKDSLIGVETAAIVSVLVGVLLVGVSASIGILFDYWGLMRPASVLILMGGTVWILSEMIYTLFFTDDGSLM